MPRYSYICDACGLEHDEFVPMSQYQKEVPCPQCGAMMPRTFAGRTPHTLDKPFHKPIEMYSVAPETPAEVADFRRKNPDVQLNDQLVPMARNRAEKLRILRNAGYEEKS